MVGREYHTIEKTHIQAWLLARTDAAVAAKRAERERLTFREPSPGFVGTVAEAIEESPELFVSDVMSHFA